MLPGGEIGWYSGTGEENTMNMLRHIHGRWLFGLPVLIVGLVQGIDPPHAAAETCLSPYVKRLDRPEKYLYLFCVDADARDNDFATVIDVNPDSLTYGTILNTVDLGSKGNETHHWGYTDDRTRIWAGGLFSNRIWILDVATDPARPRIEKVIDNVTASSGLSGPHSYYALPGRMLIAFLGAGNGGLPAGLAEFTNDGKFIRRIENPSEAPYGYDVAVKPTLNRMVTSSFTPVPQLQEATRPDGPQGLRPRADRLGLQKPPAHSGGQGGTGPTGSPLELETRE